MPYPHEHPSESTPLLAEAETALTAEGTSKADEFPLDKWEAMQHIKDIQHRKEKYRGDGMVRGILKHLQKQKSSPEGCFYELLQNANDANYGSRLPRLSIRYHEGYLSIESNEVGFSKANVEAICSAAESSKMWDPIHSSVGEKGIGFKSVFEISTSVWIISKGYSFRFDRDGELGWIFPHWDEEPPVQSTQGLTLILLRIDQSQEAASVGSRATVPTRIARLLEKLEPIDLLFLSKIKHVEVDITDESPWTGWVTGTRRRGMTLDADLLPNEYGVLLDTMVSRDGIAEHLVAWRYKHPTLPSRRTGLANGLVLVFSRDIPLDRPIPTKKMYAFLPIRDYGFKFAIHSDFNLVLSRESITQDWLNERIIEHIPNAMAQAVASFRDRYSDLWYRWPLLLPVDGMRDNIVLKVPQNTRVTFSQHKILEDIHGNCHRPHELHLVPEKFRDAQGRPLLPPHCSKNNLLSEKYPVQVLENLKHLGVKTLSDKLFLSDLAHFAHSFATHFRRKSESWHRRICKLLLDLLPTHRAAIEGLSIIPLKGTRWVSAKDGFLYFGAHIDGPAFPESIRGVGEINRQIQKTSERGKLFGELGAQDTTKLELCKYIIKEHENPSFRFLTLPVQEMVSHFEFLYHAHWESEYDTVPDFWCCTSTGDIHKRRISELYMQSASRYSASSVSALIGSKLHFVHPMYRERFMKYNDGLGWLENTLKIRTKIRVAQPGVLGGWKLHGDFKSLLVERPLNALDLLRHHWPFYSSWFRAPQNYRGPSSRVEHDAPPNLDSHSREKLRHNVAETKVPCHGGHQGILGETYLATESLITLCNVTYLQPCREGSGKTCGICELILSNLGLPRRYEPSSIVRADRLLEVPEPERGGWDFLQTFNVVTKPGAALYVDHLRRIRGYPTEYEHMKELYRQLEKFCRGSDEERIKSVFQEKDSIYIPDLSSLRNGAWYSSSAVVWKGPSCLRHVPRLEDLYDQTYLFNIVLEKPIADLGTLKIEAEHLVPTDINHVTDLLHCISNYLGRQSKQDESDTDWLHSCRIFPVNPAGDKDGSIVLRSASETWLIPDHTHVRAAFLGVVDLSFFSAECFNAKNLRVLSSRLDLSSRYIWENNYIKTQRSDHIGDIEWEGYAESIRNKAGYIASLIPPQLGSQAVSYTLRLLQTIRVFQSNRIETRWVLKVDDTELHSNAVKGRIASKVEDDRLTVYMVVADDLLVIGYVPVELSEELAARCAIKNDQDRHLLTKILTQSNSALIKADLANRSRGNTQSRFQVPTTRPSHIPSSNFNAVETKPKTGGITSTAQVSPTALDSPERATHEVVPDISDDRVRTKSATQETQKGGSEIDGETTSSVQTPPAQGRSNPVAAYQEERLNQMGEHSTQDRPDDGPIVPIVGGANTTGTEDAGIPTLEPLPSASPNQLEQAMRVNFQAERVDKRDQLAESTEASTAGQVRVLPRVEVNVVDVHKDERNTENDDQLSGRCEARSLLRPDATGALPYEESEEQRRHAATASPKTRDWKVPSDLITEDKLKEQFKDDSSIPPQGDRGRRGSLGAVRRSRSAIGKMDVPLFGQNWNILPGQDRQDADVYRQPIKTHVEDDDFVDMASGRFVHTSPRVMFLKDDNKDTQNLGELYVAQYLSWFLRREVKRNRDKRLEATSNDDEELPASTFTLKDDDGRLRELLIKQNTADSTKIDNVCTFYIDVFSTNQDASWPFSLSQELYRKAERLALSKSATASKVYLLVRVYRVLTEPGIAFYADPWALYSNASISLKPTGSYTGMIQDSAPVILQERSLRATVSAEAADIYRSLFIDRTQIRLLKLEPSDDDRAPLKAELVRVSLDKTLRFWAISYCWGGNPGKYGPFMQVNDIEIAVTESLWACLHCLRRKRVTALLWADAVCINQQDPVEKAMQVGRMGSLYRLADQVMVWLGSTDGQDYDAMQILEKLHSQPLGPGTVLHGSPKQDLEAGRRVKALLQRSWFTRAWIVQEVVFGSQVTVLSGDSELTWDNFIDGIIKCEAHMKRVAGLPNLTFLTSMGPALALDHTRKHYSKDAYQDSPARLKYDFLTLVEYFFYTESSRRRDKLFALLNLAWDTSPGNHNFQPDYITTNDDTIVGKYATQLVEAGYALRLMYRAGRDKGAKFSSWIPDLMNQAHRMQYPPTISTWNAAGKKLQTGFSTGFSAGDWSSNDAKVIKDTTPPVLEIRGIMFDSIQSCTRPLRMSSSIQFSKVLTELRQFLAPLRMYRDCSPNWQNEVLVGCLTGDAIGPQIEATSSLFQSSSSSSNQSIEKWPEGYAEVVLDARPDQDARAYIDKTAESRRLIEQFWETSSEFMNRIPHAAACITGNHNAGIVPGDARYGDRIFIPHGANVPFVLRKRPESVHFELIGECYIHNNMYRGEERTPRGSDEVVWIV
ncbi:hypothetical protein DPV78_002694 [Talaromyces pinophilus]|nr:hypothetical protein DPV78_002694 [Talaromyces pinophilus]